MVLSCDASPYGLGAVRSHTMPDVGEQPVTYIYASRTLTSAECNYAQIDKEALAMAWEVKKFVWVAFHSDHRPSATDSTL